VEHQADDTDRKQQCGTLCWLHALVNGRSGGKDGISLVSWERHVTDVPLATGCTLLHREICQTRNILNKIYTFWSNASTWKARLHWCKKHSAGENAFM